MKLVAFPLWSAAGVAVAIASSAEALKSYDDQQSSLHANKGPELVSAWPKTPGATAFLQEAVAAELTEQIHEELMQQVRAHAEPGEDEGGGSGGTSFLRKVLATLKPALKEIFESTTRALRPVIASECRRVVSDVQGSSVGGHSGRGPSEDEDDFDDDGDLSFISVHVNGEFWDTLRDTVKKGISKFASPALALLAAKLAPAFQKFGEKTVPMFKEQLQQLIRTSCDEAEREAGV